MSKTDAHARATYARRVVLALALGLSLLACGKSSPTVPTAPSPPAATRIVALTGNLTFGDVEVGATKDLSFSVSNTGNAPLTVTGITTPTGYAPNWTSGTLAAGSMQSVTVRFTPTAEQRYSGTATVSSNQTSGSNTIDIVGSGTRPPRRGSVTDRAGDAQSFPGVIEPILRDLVGATIDISNGTFTLTISFAPGTFTAPDVACTVHIDTDENRATGFQSSVSDAAWIGVDYAIFLVNTRTSGRAEINRWVQTSFVTAGTAEVTYPSADQARITFPMSFLDNDDGRLAFKMWAGARTAGGIGAVDFMPDLGVAAGLTR